jgi:hypothetical protein
MSAATFSNTPASSNSVLSGMGERSAMLEELAADLHTWLDGGRMPAKPSINIRTGRIGDGHGRKLAGAFQTTAIGTIARPGAGGFSLHDRRKNWSHS